MTAAAKAKLWDVAAVAFILAAAGETLGYIAYLFSDMLR